MAFTHIGLSELDYTPGAVRTEMSDGIFASLMMLQNVLAALPIGQFGGGGTGVGNAVQQLIHYWLEDRLNQRTVTENSGGSITAGQLTLQFSLADGAVLDIGMVLIDQAQSLLTAEFIYISGMTIGVSNVTVNVTRGYNGTTASTHASGVVFEVAMAVVPQGSDLGRDMSRSPVIKGNLVTTMRRDVVITGSMVSLAKHGMVPGIPNQVAYQLHQRFWEMLIDLERTVIKSVATPTATQSEYQYLWGVLPWTGYSSPVPNNTSVLFNANGSPLTDILLNQVGINIYLQGGEVPDALLCHPYVMDRISRIFRDQIHLSQAEVVRGFNVDTLRLTIGTKPVKLVVSGYYPNPLTVEPVATFIDLDRWAIIPFLDRFCFLISAPTTKDADILSVVIQAALEARSTGTDTGYTSQTMRNFAV